MKKKICVITGTRAEYGLMSRLMRFIKEEAGLQLQIIATNMHLSAEYGETYKEIEADGFIIDKKVPILSSSDTVNATVKSVGAGVIGFADAYEELRPDMILILGDRYELLAAASAALFYKIPIIHLHGGEITEGAYDDPIRHAITKMSHLHFTSTEEYRRRVIQMGEKPESVFYVGALGCDNIRQVPLLGKEELEASLNFTLDRNTVLVTFHPVTMENNSAEIQFNELLSALNYFENMRLIFTMPNSDTDGKIIMSLIKEYAGKNPKKAIWYTSLGIRRYLSVMQYIGAVVGNSSSGIIEVPSFRIPTLNIGDRQKGRIAAQSIVNCLPVKNDIIEKLEAITKPNYIERLKDIINPYDKPNTAQEIVRIIKKKVNVQIVKKFYNIKAIDLKRKNSDLPLDAVLMAGGKGLRLRPLTEKTPKPLLKIGEKAIIDHNIDNLISYGVEHVYVTTNYLAEQIEEHFKQERQGIKINCVREKEYLGTIASVRLIPHLKNENILIMNSDLFTNADFEDFYHHFIEKEADMSVAAIPYSVNIPYGIFELDGRNVLGIKEKPKYNYYANAGIYIIKKKMLNLIPDGKYFNATDFMELLISQGKIVVRYPLTGYWIDIGNHVDYLKAQDIVKHVG